jgi:hypothetical protein
MGLADDQTSVAVEVFPSIARNRPLEFPVVLSQKSSGQVLHLSLNSVATQYAPVAHAMGSQLGFRFEVKSEEPDSKSPLRIMFGQLD